MAISSMTRATKRMSWRNDLEAQRRHFLARRRLVTLLIRQSGTEQCVLYASMVFGHSRACPHAWNASRSSQRRGPKRNLFLRKTQSIHSHNITEVTSTSPVYPGIIKFYQMDALPLGSYGNHKASIPANMIIPPEIYTGTAVAKLAYNAMMGPCVRVPDATFNRQNTHVP